MSPWAWLGFAVVAAVFLFLVAGTIVGAVEAERRARAAEAAHDPRCISLTTSEFNKNCDCATFRAIDENGLRTAMSSWLTQAMSIDPGPTLFDLADLREWVDNGCPGEMPWPKGDTNDKPI